MAGKNKNRNAESSTPAANAAIAGAANAAAGEIVDPNAVPAEEKPGRKPYSANIIVDSITDQPFDLLSAEDPLDTATRYAGAFLGAKMEYSGGYKKYVTNNGYSNSDFPKELETSAHLMVCIISLAVLGQRAADGDEEAKTSIKIMMDFAKHAQDSAVDIAKMGHLEALKALGVDISALEVVSPSGANKKSHAKAGK